MPIKTTKNHRLIAVLAETYRFFKVAPYAISVIWKYQPVLLAILAFSTILDGISPALAVWIMRYLLDAIVNAFQHQGQIEYIKKAVYMIMLQIAVTGASTGIGKIMSYFQNVLSAKFSLAMLTDLIRSMSFLEMKYYDDPEIYDMISRAKGEAQSNKPLSIISNICDVASSLITWLSFSVVLFRFAPIVVVAMFAVCIPFFILNVYFARRRYKLQYCRTHDQRAASYLSNCFTERRSLPEIITRDLWQFLRTKWLTFAQIFIRQDISLMKRNTVAELIIIVISFLGRGCVNSYIIVKCLLHFADYSVGLIVMYIQSFSGGVNALAQVMQRLSAVYEGSCFLQNYQQFLELQKTSAPITKAQRKVPEEIESIEYRNVSFIYPGSSTYALRDINVAFKKGQSTLLVGRNGAGKTTLARLLVGLYSPTEGQILINGYDMREYDLTLLRKKMSIIFQDFVRYALTMEENIGLGSVEHINDRQRIINAAKSARLNDIIARLPNGYATMLGKEFRDGQDLSLGEWQRVCLARLFMRDASLMVYDEPSASLDIETESELLREISLSGKDRICILISHRMLRADIANRIVVIEKGKIVEQGNHDELVTLGGRYAHLWKTYHRLGNDELNGDIDVIEQN